MWLSSVHSVLLISKELVDIPNTEEIEPEGYVSEHDGDIIYDDERGVASTRDEPFNDHLGAEDWNTQPGKEDNEDTLADQWSDTNGPSIKELH